MRWIEEPLLRELFSLLQIEWTEFMVFMVGKTISVDKFGRSLYVQKDVEHFLESKGIFAKRMQNTAPKA